MDTQQHDDKELKKLLKVVMKVNPDTLDVTISCRSDVNYVSDEKTVAISKYAEQIKYELALWKTEEFYPKVDKLLNMVDEFNRKANPEYYEELEKKIQESQNEQPPEDTEVIQEEKTSFFKKFKNLLNR